MHKVKSVRTCLIVKIHRVFQRILIKKGAKPPDIIHFYGVSDGI
jgi:hypothetical protein